MSNTRWNVGSAAINAKSDALSMDVTVDDGGYVFIEINGKQWQIHSPYQAQQLAKLLWRAGKAAAVAKHQTAVAKSASNRAYETRDRIVKLEIER